MRFGICSQDGDFLSLWSRLQDEGHEVLVYLPDNAVKRVGDGIVSKATSWGGLVAWLKAKDSIALFDSSRQGEKADTLRKMGISVIGGGTFCDKLEEDRAFGEMIAKRIGCETPERKAFSSISQAIVFAKTVGETGWYFKSDTYLKGDATYGAENAEDLVRYLEHVRECYGDNVKNLLQKKIDGVALSTACWWNGTAFIGPYEATIEHKKLMDGDVGPSTGCSFNAVWFYDVDIPEIANALGWENLTQVFREYQAPPGLYDINAVVKDGQAYYLEFTPRLGADSETTSFRLFVEPLGETFVRLVQGRLNEMPVTLDEIGVGTRCAVPPYPVEGLEHDCEQSAVGTPVRGIESLWEDDFCAYFLRMSEHGYEVAAPDGLVGIGIDVSASLRKSHDRVMRFLGKDLKAPGLMYRTDCGAVVAKDAARIRAAGFPVHSALMR